MKWLMYYLIVVNLLTWIIYGIDKWKAKRRAWRIPERYHHEQDSNEAYIV